MTDQLTIDDPRDAGAGGPGLGAAASAVLAGLDAERPGLEELYKELHRAPELSLREVRTAARMGELLAEAGYEVIGDIGGTGLVGVLRNGDGPTVLFRADMDGLPVVEDTGLDYASTVTVEGESGPVGVMHACGHDTHMACAITAARLMAQSRDAWSGTLVMLFQPAEETAQGAAAMVADGLADRVPKPEVVLGQHVSPLPAGALSLHSGPAMSAADSIRITVFGRGGHGSAPQNTIDPIVIASSIVLRLQTIVARELDPAVTAVVTVGSLQAGTKSNIIPASATLLANVRTFDEKVREHVLASIERIVRAECDAAGAGQAPTFEYYDRFPLTVNDPEVTTHLTEEFTRAFGRPPMDPGPGTGSEDFGLIGDAFGVPYCYWFFGSSDPEKFAAAIAAGTFGRDIPGNHSPHFAPLLQPTLDRGVEAAVVALCSYLDAPPEISLAEAGEPGRPAYGISDTLDERADATTRPDAAARGIERGGSAVGATSASG